MRRPRQTPEQAAVNKLTRRERKAWRLAGSPAGVEEILSFSASHAADVERRLALAVTTTQAEVDRKAILYRNDRPAAQPWPPVMMHFPINPLFRAFLAPGCAVVALDDGLVIDHEPMKGDQDAES